MAKKKQQIEEEEIDRDELIQDVIIDIRNDLVIWEDSTALEILLEKVSTEDLQAYQRHKHD